MSLNAEAVRRALEGRRGWLNRASLASISACAAVAAGYGLLTLEFPKGSIPAFLGCVAVVLVVLLVVSEVLVARRLATLGALASGARSADEPSLAATAREVAGLADFAFKNALATYFAGGTLVGLLLKLVAGVPWALTGRICLLGVLFGPMAAVLSYTLTVLRVRQQLEALAELGLTQVGLAEALPPTGAHLYRRLVLFTGVSILGGFVMTADVSLTVAQRGMDQVLALQDKAAQVALVAQVRIDVLVRVALLAVLVLAYAIGTAFFAGRAIAQPVNRLSQLAHRIARGKLGEAGVVAAEDEIWAVSAAFARMHDSLAAGIERLQRAGLRIGTTTEQIIATSTHYEAGASEQATALNETSATTEELARSARQIAENAGSVAEIAGRTLHAAEGGQGSSQEFSRAMERVKQDNQAIADSVVKLARRVQQIGKIVSFINGFADRSDLLALNAELEGTKAGEVGRGFALVAGEMRRLAENVIESTREIEEIIEEIRDATEAAVQATESGVHVTDRGAALAAELSKSLEDIVALAERTSGSVRAISLATQQQQSGTDQLAEAMSDILRVTQQRLTASKQVTQANTDLSSLSRQLKSVVDQFELERSR